MPQHTSTCMHLVTFCNVIKVTYISIHTMCSVILEVTDEDSSVTLLRVGIWRCIPFQRSNSACWSRCSIHHQEWMWIIHYCEAWAIFPGLLCYVTLSVSFYMPLTFYGFVDLTTAEKKDRYFLPQRLIMLENWFFFCQTNFTDSRIIFWIYSAYHFFCFYH